MQRAHLIHDIIVGIRSLAEEMDKLGCPDEMTEEDLTQTITLPVRGAEEAFQMKDYAPRAFLKIRKICGISTESYLNSWCLPSDKAKLEQSTGRSGSLFFRTDDKRYFFKTILHPEVATLMGILKDYIEHLQKYEKTFMLRMVGLHRISYGSDKVWVLVMCNSFPINVTMSEIYDLKGRKPKPGKSFHERGRKTLEHHPQKDNEITRSLQFCKQEQLEFFKTQLKIDVDFLKDHNLMDYSLLVGVHKIQAKVDEDKSDGKRRRKKSEKGEKSDKKKHRSKPASLDVKSLLEMGGFIGKNPSTNDDEVYFVGIIDCLTSFQLKKKLAFTFKRVLWEPETLSTVKAKFYATRFYNFMTTQLLGVTNSQSQDQSNGHTNVSSSAPVSPEISAKDKKDTVKRAQSSKSSSDKSSDEEESVDEPSGLADYMRSCKSHRMLRKQEEGSSNSESDDSETGSSSEDTEHSSPQPPKRTSSKKAKKSPENSE